MDGLQVLTGQLILLFNWAFHGPWLSPRKHTEPHASLACNTSRDSRTPCSNFLFIFLILSLLYLLFMRACVVSLSELGRSPPDRRGRRTARSTKIHPSQPCHSFRDGLAAVLRLPLVRILLMLFTFTFHCV